jgi:hypothetical protein
LARGSTSSIFLSSTFNSFPVAAGGGELGEGGEPAEEDFQFFPSCSKVVDYIKDAV